ncbi:MAG: DNA polymerase III subunit delta [Gammaproteobacteria bacterium]|nr:DNA polymerase III subunit delta [Gammaproteobacteria bacterium]
MKLYPDSLDGHLAGNLLPVYLLAGDEPLQVEEAADAIRAAARAQGYDSREVFFTDRHFDWNAIHAAGSAMSLFAERRLLEIRLPTGRPGDAGGKALIELAENPPEDTVVLIISSAKVDKKVKWVKAVEKSGGLLESWSLDPKQLLAWISKRLSAAGLVADPEAARLLAERVEGNLLAAKQEIDKLALLVGQDNDGKADAEAVRDAVANSARFNVFLLSDAALAGRPDRALRIVDGLREEGTDPVLLVWSLTRDIRALTDMAFRLAKGEPASRLTSRVWPKSRGPLFEKALQRISHRQWNDLLLEAALADRSVKGMGAASGKEAVWAAVQRLTARLAGASLDTMPA